MNDKSLEQYLRKNNIWYKILEKEETVHTADAAAKTGLPLERVTKSIVCLADEDAIIAIIPGNCRVKLKELARLMNVKKVNICPFERAHRYSGYDPGATPPIFYNKIKKVFFDEKLMSYDTVYGGGGNRKKLLEIKPEDIVRINDATISDISNEI